MVIDFWRVGAVEFAFRPSLDVDIPAVHGIGGQ